MLKCKEYEDQPGKFSLYLHGYWLPVLEELRKEGTVCEGLTELGNT